MKSSKAIIILLVLIALGLAAGWVYQLKQAEEQTTADAAKINFLSNRWTEIEAKFNEQVKVNQRLEGSLSNRMAEVSSFSNDVASLSMNLEETKTAAKAAAEMAKAEVAKKDAKIAELESQRDDLTKRMTALNSNITQLEGKISDTERQLAASEGDREFLLNELKRLQAEKAELERQFSDLAVMREQVKKLKEELSIAKRLEWLRKGFYGSTLKGAERLQQGFAQPRDDEQDFSLDVELKQDGSSRVVPNDSGSSTNAQ